LKTRTNHTSTELLVEFINYYIIGKLIKQTPNFVTTLGLVVCNSNNLVEAAENNQSLCSCVGELNCTNKNYMISIPYKGDTFDKIITTNPRIIQEKFPEILKQILFTLKIAQEKFKFTHGDLNARNISLTVYPEPKTFTYVFENQTTVSLVSTVKVNIFDFGASKFSDVSKLEQIDKKLFDYYRTNFLQENSTGDLIRRYRLATPSEKLILEEQLFNLSKLVSTGMDYLLAKELDMLNMNNKQEIEQLFGEEIANYVFNVQTVFNETFDYKNLIKIMGQTASGALKELILEHQRQISSMTTLDQIIHLIDPGFGPQIIQVEIRNDATETMSDLPILTLPINTKLANELDKIKLQEITPILDPANSIDIDGYDANKLYGDNPIFDFSMVAKAFNFYDMYGDIKKATCKDQGIEKQINWGNPGYSKFFNKVKSVNWEDIEPSKLPHPTEINKFTSFTYAFVIDKYTGNTSVRYGKLDDVTELGANHVIIAYNDKIIVSGELGIKKMSKVVDDFVYYININSSKMSSVNSKINSFNNKPNDSNTDNFYYILMINTALRLFRAMEPELGGKIQIAPGFNIKYTKPYGERHAQGIPIVEYYESGKCPDDETIRKYNEFGRTHKIKNACIGFKNSVTFFNIKV